MAAVSAELHKVFSTRIWWILLLVMIPYLGLTGLAMGFAVTVDVVTVGAPEGASGPGLLPGEEAATMVYSLVNSVGYVFPLIVGSLAITSEYRHQTLTPTLLVEPRRHVVLLAKLVAMAQLGLVYGVVAVAAVVAGGAPLLAWRGDGAYLTDPEVLVTLALGVVVVAAWTVIGCALGSVLTNQVAAVIVILAFTQFVEPIARIVFNVVDALSGLARFFPGAAADAVMGTSFFAQIGSVDLLPRWAGFTVLCAYAAVFALVGWWLTARRDID